MSVLTDNPAYKAYINGPVWAEKRKLKLQQVGYRCQGCASDERLEVHHLTYERFETERIEDLMVLCHICHAAEHGRTPCVGPVAGLTAIDLMHQAREREQLEHEQRARLNYARMRVLLDEMLDACEDRETRADIKFCIRRVAKMERRDGVAAPT